MYDLCEIKGQRINQHISSCSYGQKPCPSQRRKWRIINQLLYSFAPAHSLKPLRRELNLELMLGRSTEPTCLVVGWAGKAHWSASPATFCRGQDGKLRQMQSEKNSVIAGLPSCYLVPVSSVRSFLQSREYIAFSAHSVFSSYWESWQGGPVLLFIQTDPGLSLTKYSLCFLVAYSLISPVSLSERRPLIPFVPPILWPHATAGCVVCSFSIEGIWTNSLSDTF